MKFVYAKGDNCVNIHRELVSVCGDSALDCSNVNRWMEKFKKRRVSSTDLRALADRTHLARMTKMDVLKISF
jgi:hypothetical protein